MRKANISLALIAVIILAGFTFIGIKSGVAASGNLNFSAPKLQSTESKLQNVNIQYEKLNGELNNKSSKDQEKIKSLNQQKQDLEKEREDLQKQVQARAEQKAKLAEAAASAENTITATQTASADTLPTGWHYGCQSQSSAVEAVTASMLGSDAQYANYIFSHESCEDPGRLNTSGCGGLGQACPLSKLPCGSSDITCQVAWFNGYAQKYGGWYGSYQFWLGNSWW